MEPIIRERFNDDLLAAARQRYGIAADQIRLLDSFESFMFEYHQEGAAYILRLGHSRRRTPELVHGEVDWINYLAAGGAGVARAVLSPGGELVELLPDGQGDYFLATAFVKAQGAPVWKTEQWGEAFFVTYGRLLGRIHHLSKDYQPANLAWQRPHWDDPSNLIVHETLLEADSLISRRYRDVLAHLQALPRTPDAYGMIHQDAHTGNFFVDENGRITLFDFDDCVYGHFAYDLAMVLFYTLVNRADAESLAPVFWQAFWRGYELENQLDPAWLAEIPYFMKLREIELYTLLMRDYGLEALSEDSWALRYLHGRLERIEQNQPIVNPAFLNI
ncbi:MAG: phosphotransferase [Anaerolineales bacterium]|nr:phosphotransferase [Anaerolineales bacterium]